MRILFVAIGQSIHAARWIRQLTGRGWDLHLWPSWGPHVHPEHRDLTVYVDSVVNPSGLDESVRVVRAWPLPRNVLYGQARKLLPGYFGDVPRFLRLVERLRPDVIHSIEIQHAGYFVLDAKRQCAGKFPPWVVTNYGNDTYYFGKLPEHAEKIRAVLAACDYYDCECERDVRAARDFGFRGEVFPVTTNTGGFDLEAVRKLRAQGPPSARRVVMLKGYQDWCGRALTALKAVEACADVLRDYDIRVYLASPEVAEEAVRLARRTGLRVEMLPRCTHEEMLGWHGRARMSVGVSITDGVSTSFIEALLMGSFPIQTCTACADEWVTDGDTGFVVPPDDVATIAAAIRRAATDDALVDRAAERNWCTAQERLEYRKVQASAVASYERVVRDNPRTR